VGHTTALSLRGTSVTLTRRTTTFLRHSLLPATSNIPEVLSLLQNVAVFVLPEVKDILNDVASLRQVVNGLIEMHHLTCEDSSFEI
jgi:hypothetical protein